MAGTATIAWIIPFIPDPDAQAFLSAAGITDPTISSAINTLVVTAKANGWWTKCSAIYPLVGGIASAHKYNLKDPRDLDAAFRIDFNGSWTHSATGILSTGGYANSFLVPNTHLPFEDTHISAYSRTSVPAATDSYLIGSYDLSSGRCDVIWHQWFGGSLWGVQGWMNQSFEPLVAFVESAPSTYGYYLLSRTSSTNLFISKNSSVQDTDTATSAGIVNSVYEVYIAGTNVQGGAASCGEEVAFATIGTGVNSTLAATMYTDIQTFQ